VNMPGVESKTAILITSCDAFEDCWGPYAHGLHKYWPDCPFPVFLITNEKTFSNPSITSLRIHPDRGWARNLRQAMDAVDAEILLYTHEDFWLSSPVDTAELLDFVGHVAAGRADYIRLYPAPGPDRPFAADPRLGVLADNAPYRTSLQTALWRKSVLQDLLRDDESCWGFELEGTPRSRRYGERFLCVQPQKAVPGRNQPIGLHYVCTAINKGRWATEAVEYANREGLKIDFSNRPLETWWDDAMRLYPACRHFGRLLKAARNPRLVVDRILGRKARRP
jgi:hypothetical protein